MSLGGWLREYVYIPLGGNRKGKVRKFLNLIVTFLVSGIWHGVQYLLWGLFNGIFVAFGTKLQTRWKNLNRIVTFLLVSILWSFFVWPDAITALKMVGSVFTTFNYGEFFAQIGAMGLTLGDWIVLGLSVALLWIADGKMSALRSRFRSFAPAARLAVICVLGLLVLVFGMYGIGFTASEFIYSRF
jgi:D-alanyl-lipoteichoic acid acyltransferase DltB (MBOAT superfamily)